LVLALGQVKLADALRVFPVAVPDL
jgi:hypothetical protein